MDTETVLDVNQGVWDFFLKRHPFIFFFLVILPVFVSIGIAYFGFTFLGPAQIFQSDGSEETSIIIIFLPLLVSFATFIIVRSKIEKIFYTELAAALNCTYQASSPTPADAQLTNIGSRGLFTNVLSGTYSNLQFQLGDYTYYTGDSKHRKSHRYTLGVLTMKAALPHVMCVPKKWTSIILDKWKPSDTKVLPLEGNFNSVFTVFVPEGSEIEGLQILEPDDMEKLMNGFEDFGFECIYSTVYLFTTGAMKENRQSVLRLYTLLQRFCDVLSPELQTFTSTAPQTTT